MPDLDTSNPLALIISGIVAVFVAGFASTGLWDVIKLRLQKKSAPEKQLDNIQDSIADIKDSVNELKINMTQLSSDVEILKAANKATEEYRQARETREKESLKIYQSERQGMIDALKILMQDRLLANADNCLAKGYYTREERATFHQMFELYRSEPFNDGNPVVVELAPKLRALPMTKEEADKQSDLDNKIKSLIKP
jgi:cell division protein FtsB